jgi:hypothetical protein
VQSVRRFALPDPGLAGRDDEGVALVVLACLSRSALTNAP